MCTSIIEIARAEGMAKRGRKTCCNMTCSFGEGYAPRPLRYLRDRI